jgi:hypothetical protein
MDPASSVYFRKYGEPSRTAEFVSRGGSRIQIFKWTEDQTGEGVTMYATAGASETLGDGTQSCEFFVGLTPAVDEVAEALAEIALRGIGSTAVPSPGDTTTLSFPLWPGTRMQSMLFTDGSELIPSYTDATKRIDFIQLVPLFDSELDFKKKYGEKALWEKFESTKVPYWNSNRAPAL